MRYRGPTIGDWVTVVLGYGLLLPISLVLGLMLVLAGFGRLVGA